MEFKQNKKIPTCFREGSDKMSRSEYLFSRIAARKMPGSAKKVCRYWSFEVSLSFAYTPKIQKYFFDSWIRLIAFFNHLKNLGVRITSTGEAFLQSWMPRERFQFWRLKDSNVLVSFQSSYMKAFQVFHLPAFVSTFIPQIAEIALRTLTSNIGVRVCRFFGFVLGGCLMLFCFIK